MGQYSAGPLAQRSSYDLRNASGGGGLTNENTEPEQLQI